MYEEQLKELGLTDNEIRIYVLLLRTGIMSAFQISKRLGLHRGYIYDALERMQEKEVVNFIVQDSKKYFQATSPESIIEILKLRLENFQKIVPDMVHIMNSTKEETRVEVHKSKQVFKTWLKDVLASLKGEDELLFFGIDEAITLEECGELFMKRYFDVIKKQKVREKIIIRKGEKKLTQEFDIEETSKYKEMDEKYMGSTAHSIYGNKVAIFLLGTPKYFIIIENKEIAETYRKQFELFWSIVK